MPILDGGGPSGIPSSPSGLNATQWILLLASQQLKDITGKTWDQAGVLVPYLNLGIIEIINLDPLAYPSTAVITLMAGPIQSFPAGIINLVDIVCNLDSSGTIPGQVVRSIDKETMDHLIPGWMSSTASAVVSYAIIDSRDIRKFYVFPPQPAIVAPATGNKIQAIITMPPTELTGSDSTFPLDDSYRPAAVDYLVYRALAEETTIPNAQAKSQQFYQKFLQDLGLKSNVEKQQSANRK